MISARSFIVCAARKNGIRRPDLVMGGTLLFLTYFDCFSLSILFQGTVMNWFIAEAWAEVPAAAPQGSPYTSLIMLAVLFAVFYFLLIRPQAKRAKEHKAMISAVAKGDEVVTTGGVLGRVTSLGENFMTLEIADKIEVKVQRAAIQAVMPKGTIKSVA